MNPLIIPFFFVIGLMRVIQKVCSKKVSNQIEGPAYLHYGGSYQLIAAVLSLIALLYYGFSGFNTIMVLCSVGMAIFITLGLFTEMQALKGASLILVQMFAAGSIVLSALFGHFFLDGQKMNIYQWLGLVVFLVSIYFMVSQDKPKTEGGNEQTKKKISLKTLIMLILMFIAEGGMMIVQTVFGTLVKDGNTALFSFVMFAINALILYICYLVQPLFVRKPVRKVERKLKFLPKTLLICGAFLALALAVINILATELTAMVPAALLFSISNAIAIIVTMMVGSIVYKEKIGVKNIIGIVLCAVSLTVVGAFM